MEMGMKIFYIVGTPESLQTTTKNFFGFAQTTEREFSEDDFLHNLKQLPEIKLFDSTDHAWSYARSLRVHINPKIKLLPFHRKIAPVMELWFTGDNIPHKEKNELTVSYNEYFSLYQEECLTDDQGKPVIKTADISFITVQQDEINLSEFQLKKVMFPDINYPVKYFNLPKNECALF